jgi:WD40 repeat protein
MIMPRRVLHISVFIIAVVITGALLASTMGFHVLAAAQEAHGKLSVKLSEKFTLKLPGGATGVLWSPDGSTLGVSSNYGMRFGTYDNSGHLLHEFQANGNNGAYVNSFAFIHGASQVLFPVENAAPYDAAGDIRDVATGRILQTISRTQTVIHANYFAVSRDQKHFAIANGAGPEAIIYSTDAAAGWHESAVTQPKRNGYPWFYVVSMCFFPDGKSIAIGQDEGRFIVADSMTGKTLREFRIYDAPGISDNVKGIAVSPKGDKILAGLTGVGETPQATPQAFAWSRSGKDVVTVWRISDGTKLASFTDKDKSLRQVAWDPYDRFVAFIDTDGLILWQPLASGQDFVRISLHHLTTSLAISPDGKSLAVAYGYNATVYNIDNIKE